MTPDEQAGLIDRIRDQASDEMEFPLNDSTIVAVLLVGSDAHGTYVPPTDPDAIDDTDIMIVVAPPAVNQLGFKPFDTKQFWDKELDVTIHSLTKLCTMFLKSNPNVLSLPFLPKRCVLQTSYEWNRLIGQRERLVSQAAYQPFAGYARGQLAKMTANACEGYMGSKRKELVDRFGYDCKNASHAIRILRQGVELMETGEIHVDRTDIDAPELINIKRGEWSLERVKAEAEVAFGLAEVAYSGNFLRDKPDREWLEKFLCESYVYRWTGEEYDA